MNLTYTWRFTAFDCYPEYNDQQNVVFTVHFTRFVRDDQNHTASVYSTASIDVSTTQEFIPFDNLTNEIVTQWVEASLGETRLAEIDASLARQIQQQITPQVITKLTPWESFLVGPQSDSE